MVITCVQQCYTCNSNFHDNFISLKENYPLGLWSILQPHLVSETTTNLWVFSSGYGNALNYMQKMHQIRRIITVAQLHVCRRVLDVRGIVPVLEVFVQLLRLKLVLKLPNYIILHVNQTILDAGSWEKPKELSK